MDRNPKVYLKREILFTMVLVLLILSIVLLKNAPALNIFNYKDEKVIVIDPGHGGIDGGTGKREDILEKDINLDISLKLKRQLLVEGMDVVMTREKDESLEHLSQLNSSRYRKDLDARKTIINNNEALVFVSIHVNSSKKATARGVKIYYFPESMEGKKLAEYVSQSIDIHLYENFLKEEGLKSEILSEDYYILRETEYTGILIEVGFITNLEEKRLLEDEEYKEKLAYAIKKGIIEYLK